MVGIIDAIVGYQQFEVWLPLAGWVRDAVAFALVPCDAPQPPSRLDDNLRLTPESSILGKTDERACRCTLIILLGEGTVRGTLDGNLFTLDERMSSRDFVEKLIEELRAQTG